MNCGQTVVEISVAELEAITESAYEVEIFCRNFSENVFSEKEEEKKWNVTEKLRL